MEQVPYRTAPVSFTRRATRLNDRQRTAWDTLGADFVLDIPSAGPSMSVDPEFQLDPTAAFGRTAPLLIEIGGGGGEALLDAAYHHPGTNFLALEVWEPGVAKMLMGIRRAALSNVRIAMVNAAEAVSTMLPAECADELWTFFPDPWPKKRHHKRRLITDEFVPYAFHVLKPGGVWRLATDWAEYAEQMLDVLGRADGFDFSGDFTRRYSGRLLTRFEQKGIAAGRQIFDLVATRTSVS